MAKIPFEVLDNLAKLSTWRAVHQAVAWLVASLAQHPAA
jgi:hypothetical protein